MVRLSGTYEFLVLAVCGTSQRLSIRFLRYSRNRVRRTAWNDDIHGPEQSAVYSRKRSGAPPPAAPMVAARRLRRAGIDELLVLERDAVSSGKSGCISA